MTKTRIIIFLITIAVVGTFVTLVSLYARGYRFNPDTFDFGPNGLFVIKSVPDGAQVYLNGELKIATNATIPLPPDTYDVRIQKEGFIEWNKRLTIEKEIVTEATAHLFKSAPSLSSATFSGAINPVPSSDFAKLSYVIPSVPGNIPSEDKGGLWVIEMLNLPLGFAREPRRITDGDLASATWIWSPDGRQILLTTEAGKYLLNTSEYNPQTAWVNVATTEDEILQQWEEEKQKRLQAQLRKLPDELEDIINRKAESVVLSPDEDMVLYIASGSAEIKPDLIKPVPGASTQKQERNIKKNHTYIYDIKEDRNFLIDDNDNLIIEGGFTNEATRRAGWFPTSRHVILAEHNKITIMDYDGTNRHIVYSGSYFSPHAYSTLTLDRILILTNLGADSSLPNLYSLGLK
jgi:hypothetical protein